MSSRDLPEDILVEILSRLPVKSLLRFRSVCKPWESQISNPNFVKFHMMRTMANPNKDTFVAHNFQTQNSQPYNFHPQIQPGNHILSVIDINFLNSAFSFSLPFPTSTEPKGFVGVGSCNGLLCLADQRNNLYLCNPATRQLKDIQNYTINIKNCFRVSLGFGFDHASGDYKVVRIVTVLLKFPFVNRVELYSLNENSWTEIEVELKHRSMQSFCAVIVKGLPYWLAEDIDIPQRLALVSFNVQSQKFCTISMPDEIMGQPFHGTILEFKESVATFVSNEYRGMNINMWTLDDDHCWTKKLTFTISPVIKGLVGCRKTGEFIGWTYSDELVLYDPRNKVVKQTQFEMRTFRTYSYSESLVSLN